MWFYYKPYRNRKELSGLIGVDGTIYFALVDLARFLRYKNEYQFIRDYGKRNIHTILPKDSPYTYPLMNFFPVVTFDEVIHFLKKKRCQFNDVDDFIKKWEKGNISGRLEFNYPEISYQRGPNFEIDPKSNISLQSWLNKYKEYILNEYKFRSSIVDDEILKLKKDDVEIINEVIDLTSEWSDGQ